ncbi:hypothetical protein P7C70_g7852, partial [Phenoliferia sp. Uapishka_3]
MQDVEKIVHASQISRPFAPEMAVHTDDDPDNSGKAADDTEALANSSDMPSYSLVPERIDLPSIDYNIQPDLEAAAAEEMRYTFQFIILPSNAGARTPRHLRGSSYWGFH